MRLKTKKALIFIRTVSAVRKGLELALSRGDIVIRKPPVKHSLDFPSGEEVGVRGKTLCIKHRFSVV